MSLLNTDIIVRFGEEQLTLRDVIAQAAQQDGKTHIVYEPAPAPRMPTVRAVDQKGYEEALGKFFGCHDHRRVINLETGAEQRLYDIAKRRRDATAAKLEA